MEIYNGPGHLVWEYRSFVPSMNHYTIRVNKFFGNEWTGARTRKDSAHDTNREI